MRLLTLSYFSHAAFERVYLRCHCRCFDFAAICRAAMLPLATPATLLSMLPPCRHAIFFFSPGEPSLRCLIIRFSLTPRRTTIAQTIFADVCRLRAATCFAVFRDIVMPSPRRRFQRYVLIIAMPLLDACAARGAGDGARCQQRKKRKRARVRKKRKVRAQRRALRAQRGRECRHAAICAMLPRHGSASYAQRCQRHAFMRYAVTAARYACYTSALL